MAEEPCLTTGKKPLKPGKTPSNYHQEIQSKIESAFDNLDIFANQSDNVVTFKNAHPPSPSIPSTFSERPAPVTNRLQTPQHFSSLYPKLPTTTATNISTVTTPSTVITSTTTTATGGGTGTAATTVLTTSNLSGHAKIWYDTVADSKKHHFDFLIAAFKDRFKDKQHLLDITILQTHQGRNESVLDFSSRLLKLATNRNVSDDIVLAVAMNGLTADLKTIVMTKEPKNIEEFRHAASLAEKAIDSNVNSVNSMNQTVLNEIHSLKKHIQSINVNSTVPDTTQHQSYQPSQHPVYVQQPVYHTPRPPYNTMYPSNRYRAPQNQHPRQNFNRMPPLYPVNQNIRQPIRYQNQSQTSSRRCSYCNGFSHYRAQCPASGVICHLCNKMGHFSIACLSTRRMQTQ
ncbi:unnamed protein product [Mytilus coruscus]|uniref:CCHC-type domain-containing protein n=1 Tax=Mytilus coruscus TaxID=42192 RepID=A0A6J8ALN1_MYTCO|nr:unnamed protein product [Mytilus coruscus]